MNEIKKLDTETRKLLTIQRMQHPKADVDRLYLPRTFRGRHLAQIETAYKTTTIELETSLKHSENTLLQLVWEHGRTWKKEVVHPKRRREVQTRTRCTKPRKGGK